MGVTRYCECGYPEGEHNGPVWPYRGPNGPERRGCEATGCPVFSQQRVKGLNGKPRKRGELYWPIDRADRRPVQAQGTLL